MPVLRLGRRAVANLPRVEKLTIFYDQELTGFGLRVMPSGSRSWIVEYRPGGGRNVAKRRMALGSATALTADEARLRAKKLLARVALGDDPAGERNFARRAETVNDLLAFYMEEKIRRTRKPRTAQLFDSYINKHLVPAIGSRKADRLTRAEVVRLHRSVGSKHSVTANRLLTLLSAAYAHGIKAGILPEDFKNPVKGIEKYREQGRERYLSTEEMIRLGDALRLAESEGLPWHPDPLKRVKHAPAPERRRVIFDTFAVAALRLLLLTGCRLREILHLRWSEVDLERGLLFLPNSKTGKKTVVLGGLALEILAGLPRVGEFVIVGTSRPRLEKNGQPMERPRADLNRPWARISAFAGLAGVRLHDLRHSYASVGAGSGLGLPIIGRLLGHARPETTARYSHLADDPLRRASNSIGRVIASALGGQTSADVLQLRGTLSESSRVVARRSDPDAVTRGRDYVGEARDR